MPENGGKMKGIWKKVVDLILFRSAEDEKESQDDVITESFKRFVREERPFKLAACCSFIILIVCIGIPMWNCTTSTYRAKFRNFDEKRTINVPIRINLAVSDEKIGKNMKSLMKELETNLTSKEEIFPLKIEWNVEYVGIRKFEEIESDSVGATNFDVHILIVAEKDWKHFSATKIQLGVGKWSFIQWPENEEEICKTSTRLGDLVFETLIDVPHLNSIVRRDLRLKMQPWQIAALPLSHQKRLVWDSAPLALNYKVQVIHIHDSDVVKKEELENQKRTAKALRKFGKLVNGITNVQVSSEHLWDFDITRSFLEKDVQDRWTLSHSAMENLIKKVDGEMQTSIGDGALLRFVILETREPVVILDHTGEDSAGLAVASWGAVLIRNSGTESRAIAAMRIQMGMDAELAAGWWRPPVAVCDWEIRRARLRASVDNAMRAASAIRALSEMTRKISNIVIGDDVAARANRAVHLLESGLDNGLDYSKLLQARQLADSANSDHSLLGLLYFPMDQRTAVIIPLAIPIVLPIIKLIYEILKKVLFWNFL